MQSDDVDDDDEPPWASPEIQEAYETALGRFMLSFNRLDNLLTDVIAAALHRLKREDLIGRCTHKDFAFKLLVLDLLKASSEATALKALPIDEMRQVGGERNVLAHGHFDQNPFDGTYEVVTVKVRAEYPVGRIDALIEKTDAAWEKLRYVEAYYHFSEHPL